MKITRENYEAFFIDYLEGNLDKSLVDDFIEFLQNNPDLKKELALFEPISLEPEAISFQKKNVLYKEKLDSENEFNNAAIASLEGDLSPEGKKEFENYLARHPEKTKDLTLFAKTKLLPDETIVFNKKNKLYRKSLTRTILLWSGRAAAVLILVLAIFSLLDNGSQKQLNKNELAVVEKKTEKKVEVPKNNQLPLQTIKKDSLKTKTITPRPNPVIKKTESEKTPNKKLREQNRGRLEKDEIIISRIPVEVPSKLNPLTASLAIATPKANLAVIKLNKPPIDPYMYEERLLADIVKEKTGIKPFSFRKITRAGLNLVSDFTKDNFTYETNNSGKVTEYRYNSRLVAFSIPTKNIARAK